MVKDWYVSKTKGEVSDAGLYKCHVLLIEDLKRSGQSGRRY